MVNTSRCPLAIVAAIGRNGAIGMAGHLPWTMPSDLARFRELTWRKPMIMGRRTFESIGRVLPGRESIVVSRKERLDVGPGAYHVATPEAALALACRRAVGLQADEISLIGGATLFETMLPLVDRLHMSVVDLDPEADTFFPKIDPALWRETGRHAAAPHPRDDATCTFVEYVRA